MENPKPKYFQSDLAEMALMLICGLKLKLTDAEIEQAKAVCREKGYSEALDAIESVSGPHRQKTGTKRT